MAGYTEVTDEELRDFLADYDLGEVTSFKGIAEGVENSNYLLRTTSGSFILTLYERRVARSDLPYFLGLMEHLAAADFPCPVPIPNRNGATLDELRGAMRGETRPTPNTSSAAPRREGSVGSMGLACSARRMFVDAGLSARVDEVDAWLDEQDVADDRNPCREG